MTTKQKRSFADSLYRLLMTSPETGRPLGFYSVGNAPNGNLRIGMGTQHEDEFWIMDVTLAEASEFEVKAIKNLCPANKQETPWQNNSELAAVRESDTVPSTAWTQTPPAEPGLYWLWTGEEDGEPIPVSVLGNHLGTWVAEGQWGWNRAQEMDELANAWWKPVEIPHPPGA